MTMRRPEPSPSAEDRQTDANGQGEADRITASLAGLAIALLLTVLGLFLTERLASASRVGECLLQGRTNCVVIEPGR